MQAGGHRFDPDTLHHFLGGVWDKILFVMPFWPALSRLWDEGCFGGLVDIVKREKIANRKARWLSMYAVFPSQMRT